jgi:hypothetical protein
VRVVRNERGALARHAAEVREHFHSSIDFYDGFDTSHRSYDDVSSTSCGYAKSTPTYREDRARCRCQQVRVTHGSFLPALGFARARLSHDMNIPGADALKKAEGGGQLSPATTAKSPIARRVGTGRFTTVGGVLLYRSSNAAFRVWIFDRSSI